MLYRIVNAIGRWSMIDIFMESILVALVQFGSAVTIDPGFGAVAFAAVVILTMFAAEGFDPRLMWDAAGADPGRHGGRRPASRGAAAGLRAQTPPLLADLGHSGRHAVDRGLARLGHDLQAGGR